MTKIKVLTLGAATVAAAISPAVAWSCNQFRQCTGCGGYGNSFSDWVSWIIYCA